MWDISLATSLDIGYICDIAYVCYAATSGLAKTVVFLELKRVFTTRLRGFVYWVVVGSLVDGVPTKDGSFGCLWHGRYVGLLSVWNAEHLLNRFSAMAFECAGLYCRVMLLKQSDYSTIPGC
jgi:hypothetical protein